MIDVVFLTGSVSPCVAAKSCQKSWQLPLTRSWVVPFRFKEMLLEGPDLLSMVKPVETPRVRMNSQPWQYELLHRHAETGAASGGGRLLAR